MTIGIDLRCLLEGKRTGVGEYLYHLLRELFSLDQVNKYNLFSNAYKKRNLGIDDLIAKKNITLRETKWPNRLLNLSFKYLGFPKINNLAGGADIFYMPNINFYSLSPNIPLVVTFHDLSFSLPYRYFDAKKRWWHEAVAPKKIAKKAKVIIANSQSTKLNLLDFYDINQDKIKVIYPGIDEKYEPYPKESVELLRVKNKYNLPDKFILFLGTIEPRKNIIGLIEAFDIFKNITSADYKLVIVGGRGWMYEKVFSRAKASPYCADILFTGFVPDEDKVGIYNLAELFVYPSFYEGFGFPPLEAMACDLPVITSAVSSLPEVCGTGALLVDPYNIGEIAKAMEMLINDHSLRDSLVSAGRLQVAKFVWSKTANELLETFKEINR